MHTLQNSCRNLGNDSAYSMLSCFECEMVMQYKHDYSFLLIALISMTEKSEGIPKTMGPYVDKKNKKE